MADNNNDEKLRISAELDTSNLKREAQQGMQAVVNEEKKVENQSKQTSKAVDDIGKKGKDVGKTLQQIGNNGTQALKQVGQEADKTAKKINEIAKATKSIDIKQGIGIATNIMGQLAPLGQAAGSAMGMSDDQMSTIGATLSGAASGAALGTMINPGVGTALGAAAGALTGAATSLLEASVNFKEAAEANLKDAKERAGAIVEGYEKNKSTQEFNSFMATASKEDLEAELKKQEKAGGLASASVRVNRDMLDWATSKMDGETDKYKIAAGAKTIEEYNQKLAKSIQEEAETQARINLIKSRIEAINKQKEAIEEAEKRRQQQIKDSQQKQLDSITQNKEKSAELRNLEKEVKTSGGFEGIMSDLKAQAKAAWEKAQKSVGTEDFQKNLDDYNFIQEKIKTASSAEGGRLGDILAGLKDEKSNAEGELDKTLNISRGYKLTDSLTNIGGSSGYFAQMSGVNSYVKDISTTLKDGIKDIVNRMDSVIRMQENAEAAVYSE